MRLSWPHLTWRQATWADRTFYAQTRTCKYQITHDGRSWRLRAWSNNDFTPIDSPDGRTLAELQQIADDHAAAHTKP